MLEFKRVDSSNLDFIKLVEKLDAYLAVLDGKDHSFYAQFNKTDNYKNVLVAYYNNQLAACGAIVPHKDKVMEVKRMYTEPNFRGKGIGTSLLIALESFALELGSETCILETGKRMPDAVALYHKNGYSKIPNYGQYIGVENSICFEKDLIQN